MDIADGPSQLEGFALYMNSYFVGVIGLVAARLGFPTAAKRISAGSFGWTLNLGLGFVRSLCRAKHAEAGATLKLLGDRYPRASGRRMSE